MSQNLHKIKEEYPPINYDTIEGEINQEERFIKMKQLEILEVKSDH